MEVEFDTTIELLKKYKQYIIKKLEGQDTLEAKNKYINELNDIDEKLFKYYKNKKEIDNLNKEANKTKIKISNSNTDDKIRNNKKIKKNQKIFQLLHYPKIK